MICSLHKVVELLQMMKMIGVTVFRMYSKVFHNACYAQKFSFFGRSKKVRKVPPGGGRVQMNKGWEEVYNMNEWSKGC